MSDAFSRALSQLWCNSRLRPSKCRGHTDDELVLMVRQSFALLGLPLKSLVLLAESRFQLSSFDLLRQFVKMFDEFPG